MRIMAFLALMFLGAGALMASQNTSLAQTQANVHFNLALNYFQRQNLDQAEVALKKALEIMPDHFHANYLLGQIAVERKDFKEAVNLFQKAVLKDPKHSQVLNSLALAQYKSGATRDALKTFSRLSEQDPKFLDAFLNLGFLSASVNRWEDSKAAYQKAVTLDPGSANGWLGLAEASRQTGDLPVYAEALQNALNLNPDDKELRMALAEVLYQLNRNQEALKVLERLSNESDADVEFLYGCIYYREGLFQDSLNWFERALQSRPKYSKARFNMAITLFDQGKYEESLEQFALVIKEDPQDKDAQNYLNITKQVAIQTFLRQGSEDFVAGDFMAALAKWGRALKLDSSNRVIKDLVETAKAQLTLRADEMAQQGNLAFEEKRFEEAVHSWSKALEMNPENIDALNGLEKARDETKKLIAVYFENFNEALKSRRYPRALEVSESIRLLNRAEGQKAQKMLDKQIKLEVAELTRSARAHKSREKLREAVRDFERAFELTKDDEKLQLELYQTRVALRLAVTAAMENADKFEKSNEYAKAFEFFQKVLALQPDNSLAQEGVKRLARRAKAEPVDPKKLDDLYYEGVYAYAAGETEKAIKLWENVLKLDSGHQMAKDASERAKKRQSALSK
jgi:tetratricopeptide (TPR) repeat protein